MLLKSIFLQHQHVRVGISALSLPIIPANSSDCITSLTWRNELRFDDLASSSKKSGTQVTLLSGTHILSTGFLILVMFRIKV